MDGVGAEIIKTKETKENGIKYLNINVSNSEVDRNPDIVRLCANVGIEEYVKPKTGYWIAQDIYNCHTEFKCSECGYIHSFMHLYGEPTADYTYCPNCGAKMIEPQESEGEE